MSTKKTKDQQQFPGAAIDAADRDAVTPALEKQYTRTLNNNPRNDN